MMTIAYNTLLAIATYANKVAGINLGRRNSGWTCDTTEDVCFRVACGRLTFEKMAQFEAVRVYAESLIGEPCDMYVGMYGDYDDAYMSLFIVPQCNKGLEHAYFDFETDYKRIDKEMSFVCSSDDFSAEPAMGDIEALMALKALMSA